MRRKAMICGGMAKRRTGGQSSDERRHYDDMQWHGTEERSCGMAKQDTSSRSNGKA